MASTEFGDVPYDQEVAGEPECADDRQLMVDLGPSSTDLLVPPGAVALHSTSMDQILEILLLVVTGRDGKIGQRGRDEMQVERTVLTELGGPLHNSGPSGEPSSLLGPGP